MEKLLEKMDTSLNINLANDLIHNMKILQQDISKIQDNSNRNYSDTITQFSLKLSEFKRENMEDMKMILTNHSNQTVDKIAPLIQMQASSLLDKTTLLINDLLPRNEEKLCKEINNLIKNLQISVLEETNKISSSNDKKELEVFLSNFEKNFNTLISSSESRIDGKLNEVRDLSMKNITIEESLRSDLSNMLNKMENSSIKGKISENILNHTLQGMYPNADIQMVGNLKETGDIILSRHNKVRILIENKNYGNNVTFDEVKKFIRDVEIQNCNGLFLSQKSGIAHKNNFEINIQNNHVLMYVHNANYDPDKIKIAVDVIDHFSSKLDEICKNNDSDSITKELLNAINIEYQAFISNKLTIVKSIKEQSEKLTKQIETLSFPSLEGYLSDRYSIYKKQEYECTNCNSFYGKNQSALSAHMRACTKKIIHSNPTTEEPLNELISNDFSTMIDSSSIVLSSEASQIKKKFNRVINK
jgi:hypothetical protein